MLGIKMAKTASVGNLELPQVLDPGIVGSLGRLEVEGYLDSPNVLWLDSAHSELPPRFLLAGAPYLSHLLIIVAVSRVGQQSSLCAWLLEDTINTPRKSLYSISFRLSQ